jgi:hypothetical protein
VGAAANAQVRRQSETMDATTEGAVSFPAEFKRRQFAEAEKE